jgi:ABC-type sugar transport system ATPase subunit
MLVLRKVSVAYGPVVVLADVDFELSPGEIHVLSGANGAGKSTLLRVLSGAKRATAGEFLIDDRPIVMADPVDARRYGIAMIHQELSLVEKMSIVDNLFLGDEQGRGGFSVRRALAARARQLLDRVGIDLDPRTIVETLPMATRQLIEIAKALRIDTRYLILDEPTSSLGAGEKDRLFSILRNEKARGCAIAYVTHKMSEIRELGDRVTILRDGKRIGTHRLEDIDDRKIVEEMIGQSVSLKKNAPSARSTPAAPHLLIRNLSVRSSGAAADVKIGDLSVGRGEIVGIAGLAGSGAGLLLEALFGAHSEKSRAEVCEIGGARGLPRSPREAVRRGIALLPQDRKNQALCRDLSVEDNILLASFDRCAGALGFRRYSIEMKRAATEAARVRISAPSLAAPVSSLSGGNQQKVVLARWLADPPDLWLLDEPTRGVDIGAKSEIHDILVKERDRGAAILLHSTEIEELFALCDRIVVMARGEIVAEFFADRFDTEKILSAAMGPGGAVA